MSGYNIRAGRDPKQINKMKYLVKEGICAFCPEHFAKYHDNAIEVETDHWIVSKNDYPYDNTSLHLLFVSKEHVSTLKELSKVARFNLTETVILIEEKFKLFSFSLAMRVGDSRYNGGSVDHLHAHLIVGDFTDPKNHKKVKFKMSSVPDEV